MAIYQFLDFTFCATTFALMQSGKEKPIRPKTAQALLYFLQHPKTLITKQQLFNALWQSEDVQDYRLFQVISELRKLAPEQQLIRTQPNAGYIWQTEVTIKPITSKKPFNMFALAASMICVVSTIGLTLLNFEQTQQKQVMLPALGSYSNAVVAFQEANYDEAEKWLTFTLKENPDSIDAQLLLAEVKYQQNEHNSANSLAFTALNNASETSYYRAQALDLLSRIALETNQIDKALSFAVKGKQVMNRELATCSAHVVDKRIASIIENAKYTEQNNALENPINTASGEILVSRNQTHSSRKQVPVSQLCQQLTQPVTSTIECITTPEQLLLFRDKQLYS